MPDPRCCLRRGCLLALIVACLPWPLSCEGTETDNPVVMFEGSQCKKDDLSETTEALAVKGTRIALTSSDYDGLNCFAWEASSDGKLRIDALNVGWSCLIEVDWQHRAERHGEALELVITAPRCEISACGSCIYDFSFELRGIDLAAPLPLTLRQETAGCPSSYGVDDEVTELTLPLDRQDHGVVCRQLPTGITAWTGPCGGAHRGCSGACEESPGGVCDPGLVCDEGAGGGICLMPCESDGDCPLGEVESCQEGVCRVPEAF